MRAERVRSADRFASGARESAIGLVALGEIGYVAGSMGADRGAMGGLVLAELERWIKGEDLQHRITASALTRMA